MRSNLRRVATFFRVFDTSVHTERTRNGDVLETPVRIVAGPSPEEGLLYRRDLRQTRRCTSVGERLDSPCRMRGLPGVPRRRLELVEGNEHLRAMLRRGRFDGGGRWVGHSCLPPLGKGCRHANCAPETLPVGETGVARARADRSEGDRPNRLGGPANDLAPLHPECAGRPAGRKSASSSSPKNRDISNRDNNLGRSSGAALHRSRIWRPRRVRWVMPLMKTTGRRSAIVAGP